MWKVSYQKLMAILLSSRYISEKKETPEGHVPGENEEISGSKLKDLLKAKASQY